MSLVVGGAWGQVPDAIQWARESRKHIAPFAAEYKEVILVHVKPVAKEGGVLGRGAFDSECRLIGRVDPTSSELRLGPDDPSRPGINGGNRTHFNDGKLNYQTIDSGSRGNFGKQHSGETNPAAAGYEIFGGYPLERVVASYKFRSNPDGTISGTDPFSNTSRLWFASHGSQTQIQRVWTDSADGVIQTDSQILEWIEFKGFRYPKKMTLTFYEATGPTQSRIYTLIKVLPELAVPLKFKFQEGASVRDEETNTMYNVIQGKLVADPVFMKAAAREASQRRMILVGCFLAVVGWAIARTRRKANRRAKVQPA